MVLADPNIAQKAPYRIDVEAGGRYFWCACGKSQDQPFCDGSHQGSEFLPVRYDAPEDATLFFCGCKRTGNAPMCDGTHNGL